jgi:HlyD family secretion protein
MANSKKRRKLIVFSIIAVVLLSLTLAAVFRKREVLISITTDKVARRNLTELVVANGKIQPVVQVVISPEVAGEIVALPVKEGDQVKKGDLLVQIKPDNYRASRNSAEASLKSAYASTILAQAELEKAEAEFLRNQKLFRDKFVSDSIMLDFKTAYEVAKLRYTNSVHQASQAQFALDKAADDLSKTTIVSPIEGTVTRLRSQLGERVLGTSFNMGTEIMTVSDLNEMEARVDIGEIDVVLIQPGQKARLEVDAFKDRRFSGVVTEIANSSKGSGSSLIQQSSSQNQEATKFEVRIRIAEKENFRPGMSVSTEIETRYRTNVLSVPYAAITTRMPKGGTNSPSSKETNAPVTSEKDPNDIRGDRKKQEAPKTLEVVFVTEGDHVKQIPVKKGICDENYWEIIEGLNEGQEIVSGGYKAVNRELEDGKKFRKGGPEKSEDKDKK